MFNDLYWYVQLLKDQWRLSYYFFFSNEETKF